MRTRMPPPRRRRTEPTFPLIPAIIAVILAGFAIGAAISYVTNRGPDTAAQALPSPSPILAVATPPRARLAPPLPATPGVLAIPSPSPSAARSPVPSRAPNSPAPAATPAPFAALTPAPRPTASATPAPRPSESVTPAPHPTGSATPAVHSPPSPQRTAASRAAAAPRASPSPSGEEYDSRLAREAGALVRKYIGALVTGDEGAAKTALGEDASSPGLHMAEEEFIDRSTRITGLRTHTSGETVTVETDIEAARGTYFARFLVARGANGLVIREHDYIKP